MVIVVARVMDEAVTFQTFECTGYGAIGRAEAAPHSELVAYLAVAQRPGL